MSLATVLLALAYTLVYLPGETSFLAGLEQAKWRLAYLLVTGLLLWRLTRPGHRPLAALSLLALLLPFAAGPGGWVWGRDPELIAYPLAAILLLAALVPAISPRGAAALNALAVAALWLYPIGALGGLGLLPALGYTPFLDRTAEYFPRAFTWPSPGYAAGVFAPLAALLLVRSLQAQRPLFLFSAAVLLALMLAGGNRTGPAAALFASLLVAPLVVAQVPRGWTLLLGRWGLALGLALALFALYPLPGTRPTTLERDLHDLPTFNSRVYLWQGALAVLSDHPLGVGPDRFLGVLALSHPELAERMVRALAAVPREASRIEFLSDTPLARVELPGRDRPVFFRLGSALAHNGFLDLALVYGLPIAVLVFLAWIGWMAHLYRHRRFELLAMNLALFLYALLWTPIFSVLFPFVAIHRLVQGERGSGLDAG